MCQGTRVFYEFGGFRLDPAQRILARNGEPVALWPKVFDTLVLLVQSSGRILEKGELIEALWPESFVEEGNLTQNVFLLRKILGDDRNGNSFIQTIPRKGYRFSAPVREFDASALKGGLLADYWSHHSPFRGLQVFEPDDAWLFFGRESETSNLVDRLGRSPVLTIVGNSGCGKSSLVRAGLLPALRAGRFCYEGALVDSWRIAVFRPSASPFDDLAETLSTQLVPELSPEAQAEFIADCRRKLSAGGETLRNAISALASAMPEQHGPVHILLVVDQFEEIFTLTANQQSRDRYIDALLAVSQLDSAVRVHLVLTLRADFYGHCLQHAELSRCMSANLYNVPRMTRADLRETIERRLQLAAAKAEPGLIDALLEDVGVEPGDLALLEHALGQLWERCGGLGCTLTNSAYAEIGRLRGALGRHADEVYSGLENDNQRRLAQKIFLELVHLGEGGNVQDTRRRLPKADVLALGAAEEVELLLGQLASSRLISMGREGDEIFVEVSHETLIREWPALRDWLAENREDLRLERRLQEAAEEWHRLNRDAGALLQGARLVQGAEWFAKTHGIPPLLRDFLQTGIAARDEAERKELIAQKKKVVRQRWTSCALAFLLLVSVAAAWFVYQQLVIQKSRAMAAQSGELLPRDHGQALDLAIRSWRLAKTEEAHVAVAKAFPEPMWTVKHDGSVGTTRFSPDGKLVLSASTDHSARLWNAEDGRLLATLLGHTNTIEDASFSPDGKRVVTAGVDHTARVWDSSDGRLLAVLQGHGDAIARAYFSPDGQRILTSSLDHTARVWNSADGQLLFVLQHGNNVVYAEFASDGRRIVTASLDKTARVWNSTDGRLLTTLSGHSGSVVYAKFSPDNQRIVTASADYTARIWNSTNGRLLFVLPHNSDVSNIVLSPDGQRIVTTSNDHAARIWNSADGRLLFTLKHDAEANYAEFSPDSQHIITTSSDRTAKVWNTANGRLLAILQGSTDIVYDAAFSPSGERIVTGSADGTVRMWNISTGLLPMTLQGHTSYIMDAQFSPDSRRIVTISTDHTTRVWNAADGRLLTTLQEQGEQTWDAEFSPDGQRIVTAGKDHTARVWNAADGRLLTTLQGHTDQVLKAQFSPNGRRIVTTSLDKTARVWNAVDGRLLATLQGHEDQVWQVQFSPDGQRIVTTSLDKTARVWNAADGHLLATLQGHGDRVWEAWFSPDGQRIVTASLDKTARVWDSTDGRLLFTLSGHLANIFRVAFSPDGQRIVTGSSDHTGRVWNAADGRLLLILQGHTNNLSSVQFSPDSQRILTASRDNTARLWNAADGRLLATLQGHTGYIPHARFSPDGQRIVTASWDQTARVWEVLTIDDIERILAK